MKKIAAGVLVVLMLAAMTGMGVVAAETTVSVSLEGAGQAKPGSTYKLTLKAPATIGGIQGEIEYDKDKFSLQSLEITESFAEANRIAAGDGGKLVKDTGKSVKFVLLSNSQSDEWITFVFKVKADGAGKADFKLNNMTASDGEGAQLVSINTKNKTNVVLSEHLVELMGASVRTNGTADLRYEVMISGKSSEITEVGVIIVPSAAAANQELVADPTVTYGGKAAKIITVSKENLSAGTQFFISYVPEKALSLDQAVSVRAYMKLKNGTIFYSQNENTAINITDGVSSRSCIDVIKAVAADKGYTDADGTVAAILAKKAADWSAADYQAVVTAINKNVF